MTRGLDLSFQVMLFFGEFMGQPKAAISVKKTTQMTQRMHVCHIYTTGSRRIQLAVKNHQPTKEATLKANI